MTTTASRSAADTARSFPQGRQLYLILGALMSGQFLAALDQTIVATALPTIAGDLHHADLLSWVVTSYLLTSTATAPLYGKIGDLYGRKRIFQIAITIFLIGSVLCAFAGSMLQLILFRGLQGAGSGGILTLTFAIVGDVVPMRERGKYQGYFGATFLIASVVGPLLGGFAVDQLSWHSVFWINLPIGAVTLAIVQKFLKLPRVRTEHSIDWIGALLVMSGISALLIAVQTGGKDLSWTSPQLLGIVALGLALLAAFVGWERSREEPLLPMHLFRIRAFWVANSVAAICGASMFGAIVFLPEYFQVVRGINATESGFHMMPLLFGVITASTLVGRYTSRTGRYRQFPIIGTGVLAVGLSLLALSMSDHVSLWLLGSEMALYGLGLGSVMSTLILSTQNAVPQNQIGVGTSTVTFFRSMGGSIGASLLGAVLAAQFTSNVRSAAHGATLPTSGRSNILSSPDAVAQLPAGVRHIVTSSFSSALSTAYLCAVPIALLAFGLAWLQPVQRLRERDDAAPEFLVDEPVF